MLLLLLFTLLLNVNALYNITQATVCVWLSGASYCNKEKYNSMILKEPISNFILTDILYDIKTDLQGYIGFIESTKSIYIVLRGSSSILNWLDDFEIKQVPYTTWIECNCNVHYGFYRSVLGIRNETILYVSKLLLKYPRFSVIITGHSYGAACGDILSLELLKEGIVTKYYGYGKPRIGDQNYSYFLNSKISEHYRHTHNKDIVPHIPLITTMGYYHSCQEIFEDEFNNIKMCSINDCEDLTCGNQYTLSQTNTADHSYYLGHYLSCENSTSI